MFKLSNLGIPIIQAPMAGGINNPRLASEVSNAGGVGSFGFTYSTPQKISEDLAATKALTNGPINANFFVFSPVNLPAQTIQQQAIDALASRYVIPYSAAALDMEQAFGRSTVKELLPLQPGDVEHTYADVDELMRDTGYAPDTPLEVGLQRFAQWYRGYYKLD
mgnify:CR=1 FL=1